MSILDRLLWRDEWSNNPGGAWKHLAGLTIAWLLLGTLLLVFSRVSSIGFFVGAVGCGLSALYAFRRGRQLQQERGDGSPDGGP